jgi:transposase
MYTLGIDIAKVSFDATLRAPDGAQQHQVFPNTPDGFDALAAWLAPQTSDALHVCMEATNVYWEALATLLHARDLTVSVVNPARIKGFAQATMQRNKTDKLDSAIIAAFCATHQPTPWQPLDAVQQRLRALMRHRDDLLQTRQQQQHRLRDTRDSVVRGSLETVLAVLATEIAAVEQAIRDQVTTDATLKTNAALLTTIVGFGALTASKLLAECGALGSYTSAKAAAADVGLSPARYESGTSVRRRTRMAKQGKADLRAALFFPAITALRHCPAFRAFGERLAQRGKPRKVIIGAVMRKLMHIAHGVLKHQTPYDPAKVSGLGVPST